MEVKSKKSLGILRFKNNENIFDFAVVPKSKFILLISKKIDVVYIVKEINALEYKLIQTVILGKFNIKFTFIFIGKNPNFVFFSNYGIGNLLVSNFCKNTLLFTNIRIFENFKSDLPGAIINNEKSSILFGNMHHSESISKKLHLVKNKTSIQKTFSI